MSLSILLAVAVGSFSNSPGPLVAKAEKVQVEQEIGDISGYYTCKGVEAGGKPYSGIAIITKKGEVHLIRWMVGDGAVFTGVGIRQGSSLSASWAMTTDKGLMRGINTYRIDPGPRLVGRWATMPGPGVIQTETLTFLKNIEEDE